ncbi:hypothetical protein LJK87_35005 [Paenibacillus sp. P25]|nr:hypothetical protein LJK87_35005 [Paenibacillus sp. P25]
MRSQASASFIVRMIGLYVVLEGVRTLLIQARGVNVGVHKLGIFIPVTDRGIVLYGVSFIAAGFAATVLLPLLLSKLPDRWVGVLMAAASCLIGLVLGAIGIELITSHAQGMVLFGGLLSLDGRTAQRLCGILFLPLALIFVVVVPFLLYKNGVKSRM